MLKISFVFMLVGVSFILYGYFGSAEATKYAQTKPCLYISASLLNVREKPSLDSSIISKLPQNHRICNYEYENEFVKIENGYISAKYVNINKTQQSTIKQISKNENKKFTLTSTKDNIRQKADEYFALNDYVSAMNLALKANKENPNNKDSWEIFSKSIYMQGNKDEAINVLKFFLAYNYDESLYELLAKMEEGNSLPRE
ncbi:SH3 domain-containing protein [Helicobacter ibis]|uniref:SH3 domain-containing protein n=1 Tax=Helicobacter ibis TaxID=2962633 RepID=A0ABT4VG44_9HELI|nr:SH3 domain-containing protein [Helicobacter ibis]MDA3969679.1 SH3 domain-containing protein [Helicobacter ibis]